MVQLNGEMGLHFPGLKGLRIAPIFEFPKIAVCLDCGFTYSNLSDTVLQMVRERAAELGAQAARPAPRPQDLAESQ